MLFNQEFWAPIADGSLTVTFRRWKRPQVVAGRPYRTPAGIVDVISVDEVDPNEITAADARRAGHPDAAAVRAELRGDPELPIVRIEFRRSERPDPRAQLAESADLSDGDIADIDARLDRLDRAASYGPWTRAVLRAIDDATAVRAGDLAADLGRERLAFKVDVRKLKNLGLTISLPLGYELSPRGRAYLDAIQHASRTERPDDVRQTH